MEHYFLCPYCAEQISMVLESSERRQTYIEDCEVCCQPIELTYSTLNDEIRQFKAVAMN